MLFEDVLVSSVRVISLSSSPAKKASHNQYCEFFKLFFVFELVVVTPKVADDCGFLTVASLRNPAATAYVASACIIDLADFPKGITTRSQFWRDVHMDVSVQVTVSLQLISTTSVFSPWG